MNTVLIIGASRGIGLETVKLALKAGHSVRALSRSATAIRLHDPKLEKLDGDALDRDTIGRALVFDGRTSRSSMLKHTGPNRTRSSPCGARCRSILTSSTFFSFCSA